MPNDKCKQQKSSSRFPVKSTPRSKAEDYGGPSTAEQSTASKRSRTNSAPNIHAYARDTQASTAKQIGHGKRSSLALDTKTSQAKQIGKGLGTPKQSTARTTSAAGHKADTKSANATPRARTRGQEGKEKQLETPSSETGAQIVGVSNENAFPPYSDERRESLANFDGGDASLPEDMSAENIGIAEVERRMQDAELEELEREIEEFEIEENKRLKEKYDGPLKADLEKLIDVEVEDAVSSGTGLPIITQDEVEVYESPLPTQQNPKQAEQDPAESKVQSVEEQKLYELQQRNRKLEDAVVILALRNQKLEDELVSAAKSTTEQEEVALGEISALVSAAESAIRQEEAALEEISALKENVQTLSQDLEAKSRELDEVKEGTKTSGEKLTRMQEDFEYLANAVNHTNKGNASNTKALRDLRWKPYSSLQAKDLHWHIVRFTTLMDDKMQAVSADLEVKNGELAAAQKDLETLEESEKYWKKQTEQAHKKRGQSERRLADWKEQAEAMYQPDLEEKNRELRADLNTAQDDYKIMQERWQTQKARAQRWESEFKTIKSRAEKESEGFELACEQQRKDMILSMKEYHEKLNDPAFFEFKPLHDKVRTLERDLQITTEKFEAVKMDKAHMEEVLLPKILAQMREHEAEIEGLRDAWGRDGLVRAAYAIEGQRQRLSGTATNHESASDEKTSRRSVRRDSTLAPSKKFRHVPRCLHPKETARREAELQQLRKKQDARNASQYNFEAILKRVHRWQMDENLWENQGWNYWLGKTSWDIWDGAGWVSDVELDMETRKLVAGLKEQGFLDL